MMKNLELLAKEGFTGVVGQTFGDYYIFKRDGEVVLYNPLTDELINYNQDNPYINKAIGERNE